MTDGGLIGPAWRMRLVAENDSIPLTGDWRFRIEHNFGLQPMPQQPFGPGNPNTPHILFNNMIRPLAPYAIRGVIWYQGESNATAAQHYRTLFPLMIRDWRRAFGQGDFPLLFAQIANHGAPQQQPVESGWAGLREAQLLALGEPNTGMAVTIDIGDAKDIHPGNKQDVGKRLALVARAQVYGQPIPFSGPLYRSHTVEGGAIRSAFRPRRRRIAHLRWRSVEGFCHRRRSTNSSAGPTPRSWATPSWSAMLKYRSRLRSGMRGRAIPSATLPILPACRRRRSALINGTETETTPSQCRDRPVVAMLWLPVAVSHAHEARGAIRSIPISVSVVIPSSS